ncbi:MAG: hypothetical protein LBQ08_01340 [Holosporaceae bacterium]|jgi:opacity protein-like surface antigen|nr:hypothetical protein [Holosporaceae bacterium]
MKKVIFSAVLASGVFFAANASDEVAAEHHDAAIEESSAFDGFYFGLGFHAANTGEKNEFIWNDGFVDKESDDSTTRLGGSLVTGFGKKISSSRAYVGIEAGLDFAPNSVNMHMAKFSDSAQPASRYYDLITRRNGLTPSLALRFGFTDCSTRILTYIKAGASYAKSTEYYIEWAGGNPIVGPSENKLSGVTPIVALGIEKGCGKKMTGRLELEYKFGKNKTKTFDDGASTKLTQKDALTLRAMVCYNVKLGS